VFSAKRINPKVFNTIKRIESEDATVIDEEEAEAELASDEGLVRTCRVIKTTGGMLLKELPYGIHAGWHKVGHRGVFPVLPAARQNSGRNRSLLRYTRCVRGIENNRLALLS